jgi:hypothetical protein
MQTANSQSTNTAQALTFREELLVTDYLLGLLEQTAFLQTKLVKTGVGFHLSVLAVPPLRSHRARRTLVAERALQVAIKMSSSRGRKRGTPPTSPSRAVKIPASAAAAASAPPPGARGGAGQLPDDAPEPAAPHGGSGSSSSCAAARPQRAKKAREIMGSAPVAAAPAPAGVKPQAVRFAAALLAYTKNGTLAEICTLFDISPQSTNYYTKKFKKGEKYSELQVQTAKNMHADATAAAAAAADAADAADAATASSSRKQGRLLLLLHRRMQKRGSGGRKRKLRRRNARSCVRTSGRACRRLASTMPSSPKLRLS